MRQRSKIHSSWLLTVGAAGFLLGVVLSLHVTGFSHIEWFVASLCIGAIGLKKRNYPSFVLLLVSGLLLGLWRGGVQVVSQRGLESLVGESVTLIGRVHDDPSYDADGDMRVRLVDVELDRTKYGGEVWVVISEQADIKRSDRVSVEGQVTKGFGTIPVAMYRAEGQQIERKAYADVGRDVRDWFSEGVRSAIKEPEASLGTGFLLGQKTTLPEKLDNELVLLGLTHIVVASGYNLTILIRLARRLFARISRFSALALSGLLTLGYMQMTGFSPSMTRAGLIASLSLLAWYYGRKFHPFVLLLFSAAVTVMVNPTYAWGDLGWLLSFLSFVGVIIFAPLLHAYFWGGQKAGTIRQIIIETLSAQLLTLPLIMSSFGQYSLLSLPANVLILPFIPLAMLLSFIAGLGGVAVPSIAGVFGLPAELLLTYMTKTISWFAAQPQASSELTIGVSGIVGFYAIVLCATVFMKRRSDYQFRDYNIVE